MKLLVQSDDFGITEGCAQGAVKAIRDGIVRNTGLFANMPWAAECVALIRPYLDRIAFGLDLNLSTGGPVLPAEQIPGLVQPNGVFLTSSMNRALDTPENGRDHLNYDEVYREFEAQIQRYIALVGKNQIISTAMPMGRQPLRRPVWTWLPNTKSRFLPR